MNEKIPKSNKQYFVETAAKNHYVYLGKVREFVFIPRHESAIDMSKIDYFHKMGAIDDSLPNFVTEYSPQLLKENLANLRQVLIEVTDGCNLKCKYCGYGELYSNYDKRLNKNMSFENVKGLLDYLRELWESPYNTSFDNTIAIGFYGGEPLLNFKLIQQIISYIDSMGLQGLSFIYTMTTNAVLLDRYMDYIVDKKFNMLISLDGNEYNDSYRITQGGNPSFAKVNKNVLELKRKYPDYFESYVDFNAVLHNRNSVEEITTYIWTTFGKIP